MRSRVLRAVELQCRRSTCAAPRIDDIAFRTRIDAGSLCAVSTLGSNRGASWCPGGSIHWLITISRGRNPNGKCHFRGIIQKMALTRHRRRDYGFVRSLQPFTSAFNFIRWRQMFAITLRPISIQQIDRLQSSYKIDAQASGTRVPSIKRTTKT